jgi:hypothetical protein
MELMTVAGNKYKCPSDDKFRRLGTVFALTIP